MVTISIGTISVHLYRSFEASLTYDSFCFKHQAGQLGIQLSGGQKQRIAVARALIRDPKILLLDEATSALDAQSERIVQEALDQASVGRTTIVVAHRLSTIRKANSIAVLQSGKVVESGSHDELIGMNNGVYSKMVELQLAGIENEASRGHTNSTEHIDLVHQREMNSQSPYTPTNIRYSSQGRPAYLCRSVHSVSLTPSNQWNDHGSKDSKNDHHPKPSQWRLLQMNAPEWKRAVLGCLGAIGFGVVQPVHAYCLGMVVSIYFLKDGPAIKSETKTYCFIFLGLTVLSFITHLLQHYNFAIVGESLTRRVREQMLEKVLTFEVGWFDRDENKSAAVCARLATDAVAVRSLIADRTSLLIQVSCSATLAFVLGLIVTWRVAIVMIAMQPFLIGSFYSRSVLMKRMSERAHKAQAEGCQLASEATVNHRTITAFSSQTRMLSLFRETLRGPRRENIKQSWFSGFGLFSSQFLTTASIALTYWYGGRLMNQV